MNAPTAPSADAVSTGPRRYRNGLISLAASSVLLAILYRSIDFRLVAQVLLAADRVWMGVAIAGILPITVLRAARFLWVAPRGALPGLGEALRLTLVASALNLFASAKAGDLV